jgi:putative transposase
MPREPSDSRRAARRYEQLVSEGQGVELWPRALNRQIYLGDDRFVERMQARDVTAPVRDRGIPKTQRSKPGNLKDWLKHCGSREEALYCAYIHSGLTMTAMALELGITVARVSQLIAKAEVSRGGMQ